MPVTVHQVPLAEIDPTALARDRTGLDPEPLEELRLSILKSGLRLPVELFALATPSRGPDGTERRWGLISGYRRYAVFAEFDARGDTGFATIPAFLRDIPAGAAAYIAMIEENDIRADLSPWEKGLAAATACDAGFFANLEEAVDRLYPGASKFKRSRIRTVARLAAEVGDFLTSPESLSQQQLLRLSAALAADFGEPIRTALCSVRGKPHATQWAAIKPYLEECEHVAANPPSSPPRPGRPRRVVRLRPKLTVRRERTLEGYVLRFSGPEATSALLDEVLDDIDRTYNP